MLNFEESETGQMAINFADLVCELTRRFPKDERFGSPFRIEGGVTLEGGELSTIN
jgi:hypothetical protein